MITMITTVHLHLMIVIIIILMMMIQNPISIRHNILLLLIKIGRFDPVIRPTILNKSHDCLIH
ncbi:hypothetical protein Hanom_Chr14g01273971 [Helianthus anomalus]